jgi:hypothetical protein
MGHFRMKFSHERPYADSEKAARATRLIRWPDARRCVPTTRRASQTAAGLRGAGLTESVIAELHGRNPPAPAFIRFPSTSFRTYRDAANHVVKLPKKVHDEPHWQFAMEVLINAAENGGGPS